MATEAQLNEILDIVQQAMNEGDTATAQEMMSLYDQQSRMQAGGHGEHASEPMQTGAAQGMGGRGAGMLAAVPDALLTMARGAVAQPLSGFAGMLGGALPGEQGQAADWQQATQDFITGSPMTSGGEALVGLAAKPFDLLHRGADAAGQLVLDKTGMPMLAAGTSTIIDALPLLLGAKGIKGLREPIRPRATTDAHIDLLNREGVQTTRAQQGSKQMASMGRAADTILGDSPFAEAQGQQFTQAALRRAGVNEPLATPDVINKLHTDTQAMYDSLNQYATPLDAALEKVLANVESKKKLMTADQKSVIQGHIDDIRDIAGPNKVLEGEGAQNVRSDLGLARNSSDAGVAHYAKILQKALDDSFERNNKGAPAAAMKLARLRYRQWKILEETMRGNATGLISPKKLYSVVDKPKYKTAGFHDLAEAGKARLPDFVGNSGTAARSGDVMKMVAAVQHPGLLAKTLGAIGGGRVLNESPNFGSALAQRARNPAVQAVTGEAALQSVNDRADEFLRKLAGFR